MLISEDDVITGAGVVRPIGKIMAVSAWRASRRSAGSSCLAPLGDERLLRALMRRAEDVDADAILAVSHKVEPFVGEGGIPLERTCVEGIAVRVLTAV